MVSIIHPNIAQARRILAISINHFHHTRKFTQANQTAYMQARSSIAYMGGMAGKW